MHFSLCDARTPCSQPCCGPRNPWYIHPYYICISRVKSPSNHETFFSFIYHSEQHYFHLVHLLDELVDVVFPVTQVTTLDEMLELAGLEATSGVAELEGPQEVAGLLEVGADGVDLVDEILDADNAILTEVLLDDGVVGERDTLLVDLSIAALVDQLTHRLEVGVAVSNERLDDLEHLKSGLGELDEDTVVDLKKTEELESLALLGINLVDTERNNVSMAVNLLPAR